MIKVALDISPLTGQNSFRGQGMYTRRLWEALKNFQKVEILPFSQNESVPQADLVHYPYFSPFSLTLPISLPDKFVVTVHDLIPLVFPQAYPPGIKGKLKFEIQKFNLHKAKGIITDSYSSQSDISRFTGIAKEKIEVIYLAAGNHLKRISDQEILQKVKEKFNLPPKFVLYVNDVNYNKNLPGLVRACREVGIKLVVVGKQAVEKKFNAEHIENKPLVEFNKLVQGKEDVLRLG
ncbi:MAG: glycosyltransferase, partial [Patescibacteria group bacterium]|nr:glycosyltransferase [Patescibacteria group bacterium]